MKNIIKLLVFIGIIIIIIGIPVYKKESYSECSGEYWENMIEWNLCNSLLKDNCPFALITRNKAFSTIGSCLCAKYEQNPSSSYEADIRNACDKTTTCSESNLIKELKQNNPENYSTSFICTNKDSLFPK